MKKETLHKIIAFTAGSLLFGSLSFLPTMDGDGYDDIYCGTLYLDPDLNNTIYAGNMIISLHDGSFPQLIGNLVRGWQLISIPMVEPHHKGEFVFTVNGSFYTWDMAVEENIILPWLYNFDPEHQYYGFTDYVRGIEGYFFYVHVDCNMWIIGGP